MLRVMVPTLVIALGQQPQVLNLSIMAPEPVTHCIARQVGGRREKKSLYIREKYLRVQCKTPDGREIRWQSGPYNRA